MSNYGVGHFTTKALYELDRIDAERRRGGTDAPVPQQKRKKPRRLDPIAAGSPQPKAKRGAHSSPAHAKTPQPKSRAMTVSTVPHAATPAHKSNGAGWLNAVASAKHLVGKWEALSPAPARQARISAAAAFTPLPTGSTDDTAHRQHFLMRQDEQIRVLEDTRRVAEDAAREAVAKQEASEVRRADRRFREHMAEFRRVERDLAQEQRGVREAHEATVEGRRRQTQVAAVDTVLLTEQRALSFAVGARVRLVPLPTCTDALVSTGRAVPRWLPELAASDAIGTVTARPALSAHTWCTVAFAETHAAADAAADDAYGDIPKTTTTEEGELVSASQRILQLPASCLRRVEATPVLSPIVINTDAQPFTVTSCDVLVEVLGDVAHVTHKTTWEVPDDMGDDNTVGIDIGVVVPLPRRSTFLGATVEANGVLETVVIPRHEAAPMLTAAATARRTRIAKYARALPPSQQRLPDEAEGAADRRHHHSTGVWCDAFRSITAGSAVATMEDAAALRGGHTVFVPLKDVRLKHGKAAAALNASSPAPGDGRPKPAVTLELRYSMHSLVQERAQDNLAAAHTRLVAPVFELPAHIPERCLPTATPFHTMATFRVVFATPLARAPVPFASFPACRPAKASTMLGIKVGTALAGIKQSLAIGVPLSTQTIANDGIVVQTIQDAVDDIGVQVVVESSAAAARTDVFLLNLLPSALFAAEHCFPQRMCIVLETGFFDAPQDVSTPSEAAQWRLDAFSAICAAVNRLDERDHLALCVYHAATGGALVIGGGGDGGLATADDDFKAEVIAMVDSVASGHLQAFAVEEDEDSVPNSPLLTNEDFVEKSFGGVVAQSSKHEVASDTSFATCIEDAMGSLPVMPAGAPASTLRRTNSIFTKGPRPAPEENLQMYSAVSFADKSKMLAKSSTLATQTSISELVVFCSATPTGPGETMNSLVENATTSLHTAAVRAKVRIHTCVAPARQAAEQSLAEQEAFTPVMAALSCESRGGHVGIDASNCGPDVLEFTRKLSRPLLVDIDVAFPHAADLEVYGGIGDLRIGAPLLLSGRFSHSSPSDAFSEYVTINGRLANGRTLRRRQLCGKTNLPLTKSLQVKRFQHHVARRWFASIPKGEIDYVRDAFTWADLLNEACQLGVPFEFPGGAAADLFAYQVARPVDLSIGHQHDKRSAVAAYFTAGTSVVSPPQGCRSWSEYAVEKLKHSMIDCGLLAPVRRLTKPICAEVSASASPSRAGTPPPPGTSPPGTADSGSTAGKRARQWRVLGMVAWLQRSIASYERAVDALCVEEAAQRANVVSSEWFAEVRDLFQFHDSRLQLSIAAVHFAKGVALVEEDARLTHLALLADEVREWLQFLEATAGTRSTMTRVNRFAREGRIRLCFAEEGARAAIIADKARLFTITRISLERAVPSRDMSAKLFDDIAYFRHDESDIRYIASSLAVWTTRLEVADALGMHGLIPHVKALLAQYAHNASVVAALCHVVTHLSYLRTNHGSLDASNVEPDIMRALHRHSADFPLQQAAVIVLGCMAQSSRRLRVCFIQNPHGLELVLRTLPRYLNRRNYCVQVLKLLCTIAKERDSHNVIAMKGVPPLVACTLLAHPNHAGIRVQFLQLLAAIADNRGLRLHLCELGTPCAVIAMTIQSRRATDAMRLHALQSAERLCGNVLEEPAKVLFDALATTLDNFIRNAVDASESAVHLAHRFLCRVSLSAGQAGGDGAPCDAVLKPFFKQWANLHVVPPAADDAAADARTTAAPEAPRVPDVYGHIYDGSLLLSSGVVPVVVRAFTTNDISTVVYNEAADLGIEYEAAEQQSREWALYSTVVALHMEDAVANIFGAHPAQLQCLGFSTNGGSHAIAFEQPPPLPMRKFLRGEYRGKPSITAVEIAAAALTLFEVIAFKSHCRTTHGWIALHNTFVNLTDTDAGDGVPTRWRVVVGPSAPTPDDNLISDIFAQAPSFLDEQAAARLSNASTALDIRDCEALVETMLRYGAYDDGSEMRFKLPEALRLAVFGGGAITVDGKDDIDGEFCDRCRPRRGIKVLGNVMEVGVDDGDDEGECACRQGGGRRPADAVNAIAAWLDENKDAPPIFMPF
jgi:hypothetical protein